MGEAVGKKFTNSIIIVHGQKTGEILLQFPPPIQSSIVQPISAGVKPYCATYNGPIVVEHRAFCPHQ